MPNIAHAAWWMQRLQGVTTLSRELGAIARNTIASELSPAVSGLHYRQHREAIASC